MSAVEFAVDKKLAGVEKKQASLILDAVTSPNPKENLVRILGNWEHCGSRDCPEQSGMYHVQDVVRSINPKNVFQRRIANVIAEILPNLPQSIADSLNSREQTTNATANVLAIAASIREPKILVDPLEAVLKRRAIFNLEDSSVINKGSLDQITGIETDPETLFRSALVFNQIDRRHESLWLQMLELGNSEILPIKKRETKGEIKKHRREQAISGILNIPGVLNPEVDSLLIETGRVFSEIEEYKKPENDIDGYPMSIGVAKRDRDFRKILIWPILYLTKFDETVLLNLHRMKEKLGWERWATDSLDYLLTPRKAGLSPLEQTYYKAALAHKFSKLTRDQEQKEKVFSSNQKGSSGYTTLSLITDGLFSAVFEDIRDFWIESALMDAAYKRLASRGELPEKIVVV